MYHPPRLLARLNAAPVHLRLLGGFGVVLALAAAQSIFAYQTAAENVAAAEAQDRSEQIATLAGATRAALLQMEAGYRGYLLLGDVDLLDSYAAGASTFTVDLAQLDSLSTNDPNGIARWQMLGRRVGVWQQDIVDPGIAQRSAMPAGTPVGAGVAGLASAATSQQDITGIQQFIDAAMATEQTKLAESHAATLVTNNRLKAAIVWGTLAVLSVGLSVAFLFTRNLGRAVARVRASEHRYREMFEGNGAIQLAIDVQTGAIVDANEAAATFYGYARATLVQMNLAALTLTAPDDLAPDLHAAGAGERGNMVRRHRLASGETREIELHTSVGRSDGRQLIYVILHDITQRRRAEQALLASEERFRKQYKGIPLPTYSWLDVEDDFILQDYNDAAEALVDDTVVNRLGDRASVRFAVHPDILASLRSCITEKRTLKREAHFRYASSGQDRDRQLVFSFIFVPPRTVMVHTEDVTEARQAEQQREAMAQSEKLRALGQMATGIAHDLNQSLMLVASYSDLARQALMETPPNLADLNDLLTTSTQAALDGGETVKRLLLFTRAAPEHDSQRVDLETVVRDSAQLTAPHWRDAAQAAGRPVTLHVEGDGHSIIQGSPAQLRELMTNLIFNAVDALPTGGTIRLRVAVDAGQGIVEVIDSGVGMPPEVRDRVFEPFFTTKGERGTGLGLAMVFGIVKQHGGHIEVRSAPGEGTTFRITLPLVTAPAEPEASPTRSTPFEPSRPVRVLVVDDEPMMTRAMVRMLKPSGHAVTVALSGEEALEKLAEQPFDVVVSDMGMGSGINGWELADAVKRRWPGMRFLLATGWGAAIDPGEARARGVEAVLAKPYDPVDLLDALARTDRAA